ECHLWHLHVEYRLDEGRPNGEHDARDLRGQPRRGGRPHFLDVLRPRAVRRQRDLVEIAIAAGHQVGQIAAGQVVAVPDEVNEAVPGADGTIETRDRVHQNVTVGVDVIGDRVHEGRCPVAEIPLGDEAPPGDVTGVLRSNLRQQACAGSRADAIGTHQQVDFDLIPTDL